MAETEFIVKCKTIDSSDFVFGFTNDDPLLQHIQKTYQVGVKCDLKEGQQVVLLTGKSERNFKAAQSFLLYNLEPVCIYLPVSYKTPIEITASESTEELVDHFHLSCLEVPTGNDETDVIKLSGFRFYVERTVEQLRQLQEEIKTIKKSKTLSRKKKYPKEEIEKLKFTDMSIFQEIPERLIRFLMGPNGCTINELSVKHSVNILVPRYDSCTSLMIKVYFKGSEDKCSSAIDDMLRNRLPRFVVVNDIPKAQHYKIVGPGAETIKYLRSKYSVHIDLTSKESNDSSILVTENTEQNEKFSDIEGAIQAMVTMTQNVNKAERNVERNETVTLEVPRDYIGILIGHKGNTINELQNKYNIKIKVHPFDQSYHPKTVGVDFVGPLKTVNSATEDVLQNILPCFALLDDIPKADHYKIIGPGGKIIDGLREEFNVHIDLPSKDSDDQSILITKRKNSKIANAVGAVVALRSLINTQQVCGTTTISTQVPTEFISNLIGPKGETIKYLSKKYSVKINVPDIIQQNPRPIVVSVDFVGESNSCKLAIDHALSMLPRFALLDDIRKEQHYKVIGPGGKNMKSMKQDFGVCIVVPRKESNECCILVKQANDGFAYMDDALEYLRELVR